MKLKTAREIMEEEIEDYRHQLVQAYTTPRHELIADGYTEKEMEEEAAANAVHIREELEEYHAQRLQEFPDFEQELADRRQRAFATYALANLWLPNCLEHLEGETSTLVTKNVYDAYLAWCEGVGIDEPYSIGTLRNRLKEHYSIEDIRTGLRAYQLVEVSTDVDRDSIIAEAEEEERLRQEAMRESIELMNLLCPYCERRQYNGNRFDCCYWCGRIKKDGLQATLQEYLSESTSTERTGESLRVAYWRMVDAGEVDEEQDPQGRPAPEARAEAPTNRPRASRAATPSTNPISKISPTAKLMIAIGGTARFAVCDSLRVQLGDQK